MSKVTFWDKNEHTVVQKKDAKRSLRMASISNNGTAWEKQFLSVRVRYWRALTLTGDNDSAWEKQFLSEFGISVFLQ